MQEKGSLPGSLPEGWKGLGGMGVAGGVAVASGVAAAGAVASGALATPP